MMVVLLLVVILTWLCKEVSKAFPYTTILTGHPCSTSIYLATVVLTLLREWEGGGQMLWGEMEKQCVLILPSRLSVDYFYNHSIEKQEYEILLAIWRVNGKKKSNLKC